MQPKIETTDKSIFLLFKDNLGVLNFVDEILKEGSPEFQYIVPLCMTHDNHFVGTSVLKKILTARPEWIDATDYEKNTALM